GDGRVAGDGQRGGAVDESHLVGRAQSHLALQLDENPAAEVFRPHPELPAIEVVARHEAVKDADGGWWDDHLPFEAGRPAGQQGRGLADGQVFLEVYIAKAGQQVHGDAAPPGRLPRRLASQPYRLVADRTATLPVNWSGAETRSELSAPVSGFTNGRASNGTPVVVE